MVTAETGPRKLVVLSRPAVPAQCLECVCMLAGSERAKRRHAEAASRLAEATPDGHGSDTHLLRDLVHQTRMSSLVARLELLKHQNLHRLQATRVANQPKRQKVALFLVN